MGNYGDIPLVTAVYGGGAASNDEYNKHNSRNPDRTANCSYFWVLDLSGSGNRGRVRDPLVKFPGPADETSREVFVNYDTNVDGVTGLTDSMDPEIEYVEADGVFMFYLDYMQNPETHCNNDWPWDLTGNPKGLDQGYKISPTFPPHHSKMVGWSVVIKITPPHHSQSGSEKKSPHPTI